MGFSLKELIRVIAFTHFRLDSLNHFCSPPSPAPHSLPSCGHAAFTTLQVLFGDPTTHQALLPFSLIAYRVAYSDATQKPDEFSRGYALFFRIVPPAHTLVQRVNEYAFASIVQARPVPVFGRPVHPGSRLDYGPMLLLMPFGFHLTVNTLPSDSFHHRPARHYSRFWIWCPSSEHQRDFNPPDQCAARRTLWLLLTPVASIWHHCQTYFDSRATGLPR